MGIWNIVLKKILGLFGRSKKGNVESGTRKVQLAESKKIVNSNRSLIADTVRDVHFDSNGQETKKPES